MQFGDAVAALKVLHGRIGDAIQVMELLEDGLPAVAPAADETPAPERKTKPAKRGTDEAPREKTLRPVTQEDLPPTQTMLIEEALAKAPRSVSELRTILATKGCKVEEKNVAQTCYYLRQQGRIHKPESERGLGSDGKWTLGKGKD